MAFKGVIVCPPPPPSDSEGGGGAEPFGKCLYKGDAGQIMIFKSVKNSEYESKKKKKDSNCNFYNFSLLLPWYILPAANKYFFCEGIFFFSYLVARGWENFKFFGELLYWGHLVSFLGEGKLDHFLP